MDNRWSIANQQSADHHRRQRRSFRNEHPAQGQNGRRFVEGDRSGRKSDGVSYRNQGVTIKEEIDIEDSEDDVQIIENDDIKVEPENDFLAYDAYSELRTPSVPDFLISQIQSEFDLREISNRVIEAPFHHNPRPNNFRQQQPPRNRPVVRPQVSRIRANAPLPITRSLENVPPLTARPLRVSAGPVAHSRPQPVPALTSRPVTVKPKRMFRCVVCEFETIHKVYLTRHIIRQHPELLRPDTGVVSKPTRSQSAVQPARHLPAAPARELLKCDQCEFRTESRVGLKVHAHVHSDKSRFKFKCNVCDYRVGRSDHFRVHMKNHSGEREFRCKICGYTTNREGCFNRHQSNHTRAKNFACTLCDYKTKYEYNLKQHVKIHSGKKDFRCSFCNFETIYKKSFKSHLENHAKWKT